MTIFEANTAQLTIIKDLAHRIWPSTYGEILSKEQLKFMLDKFYVLDFLEMLRKNGHHFLLLEDNSNFVGYASYELNYENSGKTKIQKIYVLQELQGKGLGKKLMDYIKKVAIENNNKSLILNVNRFNKAKGFYEKYGYVIKETVDIEIGNGYLMEDYVMELLL